jgi:hypothetical protein
MKQEDKEFLGGLTTMAVVAAVAILLIVQFILNF